MTQETQEIILTPEDEADFQAAFPNHPTSTSSLEEDSWKYEIIQENTKMIKKADKILIRRMQEEPDSVSIKDAIAIKSQAHRQIQAEKGITDDWFWPKLIPAVINIQVVNN